MLILHVFIFMLHLTQSHVENLGKMLLAEIEISSVFLGKRFWYDKYSYKPFTMVEVPLGGFITHMMPHEDPMLALSYLLTSYIIFNYFFIVESLLLYLGKFYVSWKCATWQSPWIFKYSFVEYGNKYNYFVCFGNWHIHSSIIEILMAKHTCGQIQCISFHSVASPLRWTSWSSGFLCLSSVHI